MASIELTDTSVRTLKPKSAIYRVVDGTLKGLGVVVYPTGKKTFNWKGRVNGALKTYTLGNHPAHSVDDVRQLAQSILIGKQRGIDAALQEHKLPISPMIHESRTCDWAFAKYMEQEGGLRKSAAEKWRIYKKEIQPTIGGKSIYLIRYDDIAEIVQRKFATAPIMSNNIVSLMKRFFRWCVTKGRHVTKLEVNPIADVVKLASPNERERYLDDYELSILLSLLSASASRMTNPIRFILLTGARRSEAFEARWSEFDLEKGIWTLPSERSKNGDELVLPLSSQALALIKCRRRFAGNYDYVWPGRNNPDGPMSGYSKSVSDLRSRMKGIAALDGRFLKPWSLHDLRRTVATGMNGLLDGNYRPLVAPEVVERILNHKQSKIRRIYNRWEYFAEKKNALQLWADHLSR
jgi:integrase